MIAKSKTRQPRSIKTTASSDIENCIRERAYQLYKRRGSVDGFASDDWFQAEAEILGAQKQPEVKSARAAEQQIPSGGTGISDSTTLANGARELSTRMKP